jgi:cell division protein FtsB
MKKTVSIWFFVTCVAVMIVAFGIINAKIAISAEALEKEYKDVMSQLSDLKNEKQSLQDELETSGTDAFVERHARDQYDFMMPDELRFVITFPDEETEDPSL